MNLLAAHTDNQIRAMADKGDQTAREELARRGLAATPTTIAELHRARKKYNRLACLASADNGWGYAGRRFAK